MFVRHFPDHRSEESGVKSVVGETPLDELVDADAVVEICVTLAPQLPASQPVGHRLQPSRLPVPVALRLEHALVYDDHLFLKYRR